MSFLQYVVFWTMVAAMLDVFIDIEKARGLPMPTVDGLEPVNRRMMELALRQL